jgi:hypothetical protein
MKTFVETDYRQSSSEEEGSEFSISTTSSNQINRASPPSIINNTTAYNYKAGLWRDTFIVDLSWRVVKQGHEAMNHASYLAPTWSWASVNKAVRYDHFVKRGFREPYVAIYAPFKLLAVKLYWLLTRLVLSKTPMRLLLEESCV